MNYAVTRQTRFHRRSGNWVRTSEVRPSIEDVVEFLKSDTSVSPGSPLAQCVNSQMRNPG